ncbi:MAG: hypothetical protein AAF266_07345 [Planctomycetota bacterium]
MSWTTDASRLTVAQEVRLAALRGLLRGGSHDKTGRLKEAIRT